jgi:23S rRNA (adenine2503-C2)-methyltransferase
LALFRHGAPAHSASSQRLPTLATRYLRCKCPINVYGTLGGEKVRKALDLRDKKFNIVLMGMGEPLHNYDATMKALRMLADEHGLAVPPRRITLSTVGVVPALVRLAQEPLMPNLAISLHATTEDQRDALVPINRKYGLKELLDACRRFPVKRRERITFEYVMLKGVNDAPDHAKELVRTLEGTPAKVNLIPLNAAPGIPFERPSDQTIDRFAQTLADRGEDVGDWLFEEGPDE